MLIRWKIRWKIIDLEVLLNLNFIQGNLTSGLKALSLGTISAMLPSVCPEYKRFRMWISCAWLPLKVILSQNGFNYVKNSENWCLFGFSGKQVIAQEPGIFIIPRSWWMVEFMAFCLEKFVFPSRMNLSYLGQFVCFFVLSWKIEECQERIWVNVIQYSVDDFVECCGLGLKVFFSQESRTFISSPFFFSSLRAYTVYLCSGIHHNLLLCKYL